MSKFKVGDRIELIKEVMDESLSKPLYAKGSKFIIREITLSSFSTEEYHVADLTWFYSDEIKLADALSDITADVRSRNVGKSDYAQHKIQPWQIWLEYKLNPWDADIVKRVLRTKDGESRRMEYEKIIHICQERVRQIDEGLE